MIKMQQSLTMDPKYAIYSSPNKLLTTNFKARNANERYS